MYHAVSPLIPISDFVVSQNLLLAHGPRLHSGAACSYASAMRGSVKWTIHRLKPLTARSVSTVHPHHDPISRSPGAIISHSSTLRKSLPAHLLKKLPSHVHAGAADVKVHR